MVQVGGRGRSVMNGRGYSCSSGALVAGCKPMEGVDVVDQLLDGVVNSANGRGRQEEKEQEHVEGEERLPPPLVQWPAYWSWL